MEKAAEISNDVTTGKNRTSENKQRTTSETSNLESVSSSYSTENAESKVNKKISDTNKINHPNGLEHCDEPNQNTLPASSTSIDVEKSAHSSDDNENNKVSVGNQKEIATQTQKKEVGTDNDGGNLPEEHSKPTEQSLEEEKVENAPATSADDSDDESDVVEHDVKVCDICGDAGREDLLAICCRCIDGAEHTYCMKKMIDQVPEGDWLCEECKLSEENKNTNSSGQTDTEPPLTFTKPASKRLAGEEPRASKDQAKVTGKRRLEESESFTSVKKQALEMNTSSPRTSSSPNKLHHAATDSPRLQSSRGDFFKSKSFSFSKERSKTRLVDEIVLQRQKSTRERDSHEAREIGKSSSFKSTNMGGRFGTSGSNSKVKMLSPQPSNVPDLKSLKNKKERSFERNNSVKLQSTSNLSSSSSSGLTPKVDKSQVSSSVVGTASSGNGITNSIDQKPVALKDENTPKPAIINKESSQSTNVADVVNVKEASNKHTSAQSQTSDKVQASNASGNRNIKEVKNRDNKLKDAIEAALLKKPGLVRKNKVSDQSEESSSAEALTEPQSQLSRSSSIDHSKQSNGNNLKHLKTELSTYDAVSTSSLKIPPIPDHEYIWQGSFEINRSGKTAEFWDGLQAHLSSCASPKVYEAVNNLPRKILLNGVSRISAWPEQFENSGVKEEHVALYFFAKDFDSYEKSYQVLLDDMIRGDLALIGSIGGVELLIFPSNQLPEKSHRWNMLFFLWGVFRGKKKNTLQQVPDHPPKNCVPQVASTDKKMSQSEDVSIPGSVDKDKDKQLDFETKPDLNLQSSSSEEKATSSIPSQLDSGNNVNPGDNISFKTLDINETVPVSVPVPVLVPVPVSVSVPVPVSVPVSVAVPNKSETQNVVKYTRNPKVEQQLFIPQVPTEELKHLQIEPKKRAFIDLSDDDDDVIINEGSGSKKQKSDTYGQNSNLTSGGNSSNGERFFFPVDPIHEEVKKDVCFIPLSFSETRRGPNVGLGLDLNEDIMTKKDEDDDSLSLSLAFSPANKDEDGRGAEGSNRHSMLLFRD